MKNALGFIILCASIVSVESSEVIVVTSNMAPYNYEEDGVIKGTSTGIVKMVLDRANIDHSIYIQPWARSYDMALRGENVLIYSLVRTPEREDKFNWIGKLDDSSSISFYKLSDRSEIVVNDLEDAKKYTIGVIRETMGHQLLRSKGFEEGINLFPVTRSEQGLNMLLSHRIDLVVYLESNFSSEIKLFGANSRLFEMTHPIYETASYMAFSRDSFKELVEKSIESYNQLVTEGVIDTFQ